MNWLGHVIQRYISKEDTVLDLGCGIMQATTDVLNSKREKLKSSVRGRSETLQCKSLLGCDMVAAYLEKAKHRFPVINLGMHELERFLDDSFDVVICLDVLEHLTYNEAETAIGHMQRIARKRVIVYTPSKFHTNEQSVNNAWKMGHNPLQLHKSLIEPSRLRQLGFTVSFPEPDGNTLAIYVKQSKM